MSEIKWSDIIGGMDAADAETGEVHMEDEMALRRIRQGALWRAGFSAAPGSAAKRGYRGGRRWALRIAVAVACVLMLSVTALATTDLGYYLEDRFGGDLDFLTQLRTVSDYGAPVGASDTDQGITITLEEAYSNEGGTLLLLSLKDEQGRLSEKSSFFGTFKKGGYSGYASRSETRLDEASGVLYTLMDIQSGEKAKFGRASYVIENIALRSEFVSNVPTDLALEQYAHEAQAPVLPEIPEGLSGDGAPATASFQPGGGVLSQPVAQVPGLTITDVTYSSDGLMIYGEHRPDGGDVRYSSIYFSLLAEDGSVVSSGFSTWSNSDMEEERPAYISCGFTEVTSPEQLKGYTLAVSYFMQTGEVRGVWELDFRMPRDPDTRTVRVNTVVKNGGLRALIESVTMTRTAVVVSARRLSKPSTGQQYATDLERYKDDLRRQTIEFRLYDRIAGQYVDAMSYGTGVDSEYYLDEIKAVLQWVSSLDVEEAELELRVYAKPDDTLLLSVPLGELK